MTTGLDRDALIALLNKLGAEDDAEALAAAREAHAAVTGAGADWGDLLAPSQPVVAANDDVSDDADDDVPASAPAGPGPDDDEVLAIIEAILARDGISEALRDEMADYKADLAEGELTSADRAYLRALQNRLK